jgi:hypothetical protein
MLYDAFHGFEILLSVEELRHALGWTFAMAGLIGALLNPPIRELVRWLGAGLVFIGLSEFARFQFFMAMEEPYYLTLSFALLLMFVYAGGLFAGWLFSRFVRCRVRMSYIADHADRINGDPESGEIYPNGGVK